MCLRLALGIAGVLAASGALASDGVVEINQTCAAKGGCFSGDTAGFPVTIDASAGHSYRLTSDLVVPDASTDGISVAADYVSIDLGGFTLRGPVTCSGTPPVCVGGGSGDGIRVSSHRGVEISNGSVIGMGARGITTVGWDIVHDVRVEQSGGNGIVVGGQSRVFRCTARQNDFDGIVLGSGSSAIANVSNGNGRFGILLSSGLALDNVVTSNASDGIATTAAAQLRGNIAETNGDDGIATGTDSQVTNNVARANTGEGIHTGSHSYVIGNNSSDNTANGLLLGDDSAYRENLIASNTGGTVAAIGVGTFINLGNNGCTNAANTTVACP